MYHIVSDLSEGGRTRTYTLFIISKMLEPVMKVFSIVSNLKFTKFKVIKLPPQVSLSSVMGGCPLTGTTQTDYRDFCLRGVKESNFHFWIVSQKL